jgi:hypothetical protein
MDTFCVASATGNALAALLLRSVMLAEGPGARARRCLSERPPESGPARISAYAALVSLSADWVAAGGPDGEQFSCLAELIQAELDEGDPDQPAGRHLAHAERALQDLAVHLRRIGCLGAAQACSDSARDLRPNTGRRTRLAAIGPA